MGWGRFEKKLIASAKLTTMEKYGFTYQEDVELIKECLYPEVEIEYLDDSGRIRVRRGTFEFEAVIRDYIPKKRPQVEIQVQCGVPGDEERRGKWVSIWDVANH
ncbi:MAG: hypothetical protein J7K68_00015 [Candidatus Diapherotrites archaeon]|nr:hypothetical protein [Candidatus Diapherotrites archaeon]